MLKIFKNFFRRPQTKDQSDKQLIFDLFKDKRPSTQQLKYLPHILTSRERTLVRVLLTIILVSLILLGINFYFTQLEPVPGRGGEYIEGLVGLPQFINPILAPANTTDMDISRLIFSGLMKYRDGRIVPDLATRYEISPDEKTYTFHLRKNAPWHDGQPLTARDIIFTIGAIQDPEFKSPLEASFKNVKTELVDDYTLKFILEKPFSPFLSLTTFGIMPAHIWENIPPLQAALTEFNLRPIGSGPFQFKSLAKDRRGLVKSYTLQRNEKYYQTKPYLERITFKFFLDRDEAVEALRARKIDALALPSRKLSKISNGAIKKYTLSLPHYTAIFLNKRENEILESKLVRAALDCGLDKARIVSQALDNEASIIYGPILAGQIGHNPEAQKYQYSPQAAGEILAKEGWILDEEENVRKKKNENEDEEKVLSIKLTTVDEPEIREVIEIIKDSWEKIGLKTEVEFIDQREIQKNIIKPRAYQALLYGVITGPDPDPYPFWHSSQTDVPGVNLSGFANRDADRLLEEARETSNKEKRAELYAAFQKILAEELPAIFLYSPAYTYLVDEKIKGVEVERVSIPSDRFANIDRWYMRMTKRWKVGEK